MEPMMTLDRLQAISERIANYQQTAEDLDELRRSPRQDGSVLQWVSKVFIIRQENNRNLMI
jgi:hypothetical protein